MGHWLRSLARGPILPGILLSALVAFAAVRFAPNDVEYESVVYPTEGTFVEAPSENIANLPVGSHETGSVHHLCVRERVKAHYHETHDETVVVLAGNGTMKVAGKSMDVRPGLVLVLPRGTVHELIVGDTPVEAISMFTPPFDGKDRVFVD